MYAAKVLEGSIKAAQSGNREAMEKLLADYEDVIRRAALTHEYPGMELGDAVQELRLVFCEIVQSFDTRRSRQTDFATFVKVSLRLRAHSVLTRAWRQKHFWLNTAKCLDCPVKEEGRATLHDILPGACAEPLDACIAQMERRAMREFLASGKFSDLERAALVGVAEGEEYKSLAARFGCTTKTIDNAVRRARIKAARYVQQGATP